MKDMFGDIYCSFNFVSAIYVRLLPKAHAKLRFARHLSKGKKMGNKQSTDTNKTCCRT